jgi:DNA-binding winged helix-turn-helix (wHTH) protein
MMDISLKYPTTRETAFAVSGSTTPSKRPQSLDIDRLQAGKLANSTMREISFGPFVLRPAQFLLLEGDKPVPLGSRAMHILIALLERPGELVSKQELMALVWPNLFVEPANLSVHVSALRRALRDGCNGNRFIINIPGRGYCFVMPISWRAAVIAMHLAYFRRITLDFAISCQTSEDFRARRHNGERP